MIPNKILGYILTSIYILFTPMMMVSDWDLPLKDNIIKKIIIPIVLILTIIGSNTYHIIKEKEKNRDSNKVAIDNFIYLGLNLTPLILGGVGLAIILFKDYLNKNLNNNKNQPY